MVKAIYAGSFDPFTLGHLDILKRGAVMFDEIIIAIGTNTSKNALFTADEKVEMIEEVVEDQTLENVRVLQFSDELTVNLAQNEDACVLLRGLRNTEDMEYEMNIASMNKTQASSIESVFLMSDEKYRFVSSSLIKEVAQFDGDISPFVPKNIEKRMMEKYKN